MKQQDARINNTILRVTSMEQTSNINIFFYLSGKTLNTIPYWNYPMSKNILHDFASKL